MSETRWSGPYTHANGADGARLAWKPRAGGGDKGVTGAVAYVVRWRVQGIDNPRKRTFDDVHAAATWARRITAAKVLFSAADERGWPIEAAPQPAARPPAGPGEAAPDAATTPADSNQPRRDASAPVAGPAADGVEPEVTADRALVDLGAPPIGATAGSDLPGRSVADFVDELVAVYRPTWEQRRQNRWWIDQLETFKACYTYGPDDPRVGQWGIRAGDSKHFRLLALDGSDFAEALIMRRATNLAAAHRNRQRAGKYQRLHAEYEAKLAAWQARSGYKGRKPVPPSPPHLETEHAADRVLIKANTEQRFRTASSFVFDRAFDGGLFAPGPSPYRRWNPRGSGGRATRSTPFRAPERATAHSRNFPGAGFWVDLGDVLAETGRRAGEGLRAGERYRIMPLVVWQLAPRPGEVSRLRIEHLPAGGGTAQIEPEPGYHLKARPTGEIRAVPLSRLVASLVHAHVASGLAAVDGTLFVSPEGMALDWGNFYVAYLRPGIARLETDLWGPQSALHPGKSYDLRKAGITTWIAQGADTLEASRWSGHTEQELLASYRGLISGVGRRAIWTDIDTTVEDALRADPPRGDGPLARHIRAWLEAAR